MGCMYNIRSRGKVMIGGKCHCGSEAVTGRSEKWLEEKNAVGSSNGHRYVCVSKRPHF